MSGNPQPGPTPKPAPAPAGKPASANQQKLITAKQSAKSKGISDAKPAQNVCVPCKKRDAQIARHEYCDIQSLTLQIGQGKQAQPFTVQSRRRNEPVAATVYDPYKGLLKYHELVIETLADVQSRGTTTSATDKPLRGVDLQLSATAAPKHSSFGPAHPRLTIGGLDRASDAVPIEAKVYAPRRATASNDWLSIWPFSAERTQYLTAEGTCCGIVAKPAALTSLAMQLVVLPHEEWTVTIGVPNKKRGMGYETGQNFASKSTQLKTYGARTTKSTQYSSGGSFEHSTETSGENYADKSTLKFNKGPLASSFIKDEDSDSTIGEKKSVQDVAGSKLPLVKINLKSGGIDQPLPGSDIMQGFLDAKELIDQVVNLLTSFKVGFSVKVSMTFLDGEISCGFGYRWPQAYKEENRVFYIERYVFLNGSIFFFKASVEGMVGIEFDPWYLPGNIVAKLYLSIAPSLKGSFNNSIAYKNPHNLSLERQESELALTGLLTLELGAQAGGRWRGDSLNAKLALIGSATLTASGKIGFQTPPSATAKCDIGDCKVIGEVYNSSGSIRKSIEPIVLIEGRNVFDKAKVW